MLFPASNITIDYLEDEICTIRQVRLAVLRLDKLHPVVSGNKLFKLHYFMEKALQNNYAGIVSFGGAYSNHLVATAFCCREQGIKSAGIIRGQKPVLFSHTLQQCMRYGMQLTFISREQYHKKDDPDFLSALCNTWPNYLIVPEGGYHPLGAAGAAVITNLIDNTFTHICCAAGTATTVAGLLMGANEKQQIIGVPVLKGMNDLCERICYLTGKQSFKARLQILDEYHFGGYAKITPGLIEFMNELYDRHQLPTDFVYTGKMMFGITDRIKKGFFASGSNIICLHTGGLQGNLSLPPAALSFN